MRARRRLMASPSPVPPYLRVVEVSAWLNASNSLPCCSGAMPMPVSRTLTSRSAVLAGRESPAGRRLDLDDHLARAP